MQALVPDPINISRPSIVNTAVLLCCERTDLCWLSLYLHLDINPIIDAILLASLAQPTLFAHECTM